MQHNYSNYEQNTLMLSNVMFLINKDNNNIIVSLTQNSFHAYARTYIHVQTCHFMGLIFYRWSFQYSHISHLVLTNQICYNQRLNNHSSSRFSRFCEISIHEYPQQLDIQYTCIRFYTQHEVKYMREPRDERICLLLAVLDNGSGKPMHM